MEMVTPQPSPFMETVQAEIEADGVNITQQPDSELLPLMETVRHQVELFKLPEAADLLNQLKAIRRKSTASLADIETILEMMGR
jgi:hypothetical protein